MTEEGFAELVRTHSSALLRLAEAHCPSRSIAEEIVQETWLLVLQGELPGAPTPLWLSTVTLDLARRRTATEPASEPLPGPGDDAGPVVDPRRFQSDGIDTGHWVTFPEGWHEHPEEVLLADEVRTLTLGVIARLHPMQRDVIALRDVEGWSCTEVCALLGITEGHQRVLLHRARSAVRQHLEDYLAERHTLPERTEQWN